MDVRPGNYGSAWQWDAQVEDCDEEPLPPTPPDLKSSTQNKRRLGSSDVRTNSPRTSTNGSRSPRTSTNGSRDNVTRKNSNAAALNSPRSRGSAGKRSGTRPLQTSKAGLPLRKKNSNLDELDGKDELDMPLPPLAKKRRRPILDRSSRYVEQRSVREQNLVRHTNKKRRADLKTRYSTGGH